MMDAHRIRALAVKAAVDPRTVKAYLVGKPIQSTTRAAIERAMGKAETPGQTPQQRLWDACVAWRDKVDPICPESIYQSDHVNLACPELATVVCDILGWPERCAHCGEVEAKCKCENGDSK